MPKARPFKKYKINVELVKDLVSAQFPQWAYLPIRKVEPSGWDNVTFRLGDQMAVRLPSAQCYADQVLKEQKWIPLLAKHLTTRISEPIAMGKPSSSYSCYWSIYTWIEGQSANNLSLDDLHLQLLAARVAQFLNQLHKIDTTNAPLPGPHNFYRGDSPLVYGLEVKSAIAQLSNVIDVTTVEAVWKKSTSSKWNKRPVWVHGDLSAGNIVLKDNKLAAVIDFGCIGVGDPSCDLVIAWTFFKNKSRELFKSNICLDEQTWQRARGWALWKALITLERVEDKDSPEALKQKQIINDILHGE